MGVLAATGASVNLMEAESMHTSSATFALLVWRGSSAPARTRGAVNVGSTRAQLYGVGPGMS